MKTSRRIHTSGLTKAFATFLSIAVFNLSVPLGMIASATPAPQAPGGDSKANESKAKSRVLTAKELSTLQGRDAENPYLAGQNKWDVMYKGVNLMTGNFTTSGTDLAFEGGYGIPANVTRSYSANNPDEGPLGKGWTLSVDVRNTAGGLLKSAGAPVRSVPVAFKERPTAQDDPNISNDPVEAVIVTDSGGKEETIQKDVDGILTTPPWDKNINKSEYETVVQGGNTYQILTYNETVTPEGTTYIYEKKGNYPNGTKPWNDPNATATPANVLKVTSVTDRHGNVTTYTYDSATATFNKANGQTTENKLLSIQMPNGHEIEFTWGNGTNAPTNRIRTATDGTRTVTYSYTNGLLTSVATPTGKTTQYGYGSAAMHPSLSVQGNDLITSITDQRGLTTTIKYYVKGAYVLPSEYYVDHGVRVYRLIEPNGCFTQIESQVGSGSYPDYINSWPMEGWIPYTLEEYSFGFIQFRYFSPGGTELFHGTIDGATNNGVTFFQMRRMNDDSAYAYWHREYDPFTQDLLKDISYTRSYIPRSEFNEVYQLGVLRKFLTFTHNVTSTEANTTYNFQGKPLKRTVTEKTVLPTPSTLRTAVVDYAYWGKSKYYQQKAVKDQAGRYSFTDYYDSNATVGKKGLIYRVYDDKRSDWGTDLGVTVPPNTPGGNVWKYNLVPQDPNAYSAQFDYDSKGRTTDVWKIQKTSTNPWTYVQTHTEYGADASPTWGAATSVVEDYGLGKLNRATTTLAYDSVGRATQIQDASGKQFQTNYDLDGTVLSMYRVDSGLNQQIVAYTYGTTGLENGMVTAVTDGLSGVSQSLTYESSGGGKGKVASVAETKTGDSYTVSYTYNSAGDRETASYATPNGTTAYKFTDYVSVGTPESPTRVFQTLNKLNSGVSTTEEIHYAYNSSGRLLASAFAQTPQTGPGKPTSAPYYPVAHPAATRARAHYTYDAAGRMTGVEHYWDTLVSSSYSSTPILGNSTAYELSGSNRGLRTSSSFYVNNGGSWSLDRTENYGYDAQLDYLTSADYNDGLPNENPSWSYDAAGNRNDATVVDNLNRATTISSVSRTYDVLGNTLTNGSTSYAWDVLNRMSSHTVGGVTTSYQYRADGLRSKKTSPTSTEWSYYDGQMPVEKTQITGGNTTVTKNTVGSRGLDRIERTNSSGTVIGYPIYDTHGNMVATLSKSGSSFVVNDQRSYDAWGLVRQGNTTGDPGGRYNASLGHVVDDESGLIYMRRRYYDPKSGRFLSQDRKFDGLNWFLYCNNNPINYRDFSGNNLDDDRVEEDLEDSWNALSIFLNSLPDCADANDVESAWAQFMEVWGGGYLASDDAYWDIADKTDWIKKYKKGGMPGVVIYELMTAIKDGNAIKEKMEILIYAYQARVFWYIEDIDNF